MTDRVYLISGRTNEAGDELFPHINPANGVVSWQAVEAPEGYNMFASEAGGVVLSASEIVMSTRQELKARFGFDLPIDGPVFGRDEKPDPDIHIGEHRRDTDHGKPRR